MNLFYFSATGNSLMACRELQTRMKDCTAESIAKISDETIIKPNSNVIGFVFPVYFGGMPRAVTTFVEKVDFTGVDYIFVLATKSQSASPGIICEQMNQILKQYNRKVSSVFYLAIVGNFIKKYDILNQEGQNAAIEKAIQKIDMIADAINRKEDVIENPVPLLNFAARRVYKKWKENFHLNDREFVSSGCNSCGLCARICPVNNIIVTANGPSWGHNCELCFACIHICPSKIIQYGKDTIKRQRYKNPNVPIHELLVR